MSSKKKEKVLASKKKKVSALKKANVSILRKIEVLARNGELNDTDEIEDDENEEFFVISEIADVSNQEEISIKKSLSNCKIF